MTNHNLYIENGSINYSDSAFSGYASLPDKESLDAFCEERARDWKYSGLRNFDAFTEKQRLEIAHRWISAKHLLDGKYEYYFNLEDKEKVFVQHVDEIARHLGIKYELKLYHKNRITLIKIKIMEEKEFTKKLSELRNITDKEEYAKVLADFFINDKLSLTTLLLMAIDWGEQQPHWISVEDELPPKESEYDDNSIVVLATDGNGVYKGLYQSDEYSSGWFTSDLWELDNITHWMPLPQPPKGGEQ